MPRRTPWLLALLLFVAGPAHGQEAKPGPAIEVRVASVNDLLVAAKFLGESLNQGEPVRQGVEFVKSQFDDVKGLDGLDPKRPWGLSVTVTPNVIDSPIVLAVPLADRESFLGLLKGKLSLDPKRLDGDVYEVKVPNVPMPVFFRFTKDHVLVTVMNAKSLDTPPRLDFLSAKETSQVVARLHYDRLPADVKKVVFAQWELQANDGMRRARPGETPTETKLRQWLLEQTLPGIQRVMDDGATLTVALDIDTPQAKGEVRLDARFTAKPGSNLAKTIRALEGRPGLSLPLTDARRLFTLDANVGLPDDAKKSFAPLVDALLADAVKNAGKQEQIALQLVTDALKPTLQSGELDVRLAVTAGPKPGAVGVRGAVKTVKGTEVEKLAKFVAGFAPADAATFAFDTATVGGVKLHAVTLKNPEMQAAFGTQTLGLGTSESRFLFAVGGGKALEVVAAAAPAAGAALYRNDIALGTLVAAVEKALPADAVRTLYKDAFGVELGTDPGAAADNFSLRVTGGDSLHARLVLTGKTLKFLTALDAEKKK